MGQEQRAARCLDLLSGARREVGLPTAVSQEQGDIKIQGSDSHPKKEQRGEQHCPLGPPRPQGWLRPSPRFPRWWFSQFTGGETRWAWLTERSFTSTLMRCASQAPGP